MTDWATPPRPKYEQDDADKTPAKTNNGPDAESPHSTGRYVPGRSNGQPAPTVPVRLTRTRRPL